MKTAGTVFQTYRQEVADHFNELDEDNRRLVVRGDIKQWNQMLAETAHNAGVITNEEFAILNDCIVFFGALGKGMGSLFREFVTGADSFGQLSSGIPNSILSGIVYWLIAGTVMAILFVITGWLIIGIGYQVGKIYRKYCWDIISIVVAITSTAVVIYFGEWIKNANPINLIVLLLLSHIIYIGIRCYVKDWMEERGYY